MVNAIGRSWPDNVFNQGKWAEGADALCKMSGPRGLGSAATFNVTTGSWGISDHTMKLLDGSPDSTDVGRIWNEGLAFYGWLFYVSKFYEVVDTLIILSKGKTSSTLQTYHHAGALMCMWAGIRYMSPPIWMFVLVNSGLHGLMVSLPLSYQDLHANLVQYTYYTLSTFDIQVPQSLKRVLTSLQILQFVVGASYAVGHLFVAYSRPVSTPYLFIHNLSSALPTAASSISSAVASASATAGLSSWLKKAALRAAGEEGLAENVRNAQGQHFGIDAIHATEVEKAQEEIRWRIEYQVTHCLDTPGQVFAILLNAIYLAPLTYLFVRFFLKRYITGTQQNVPPETKTQVAKESAKEAIRDLETEIKEAMEEEQHADEGTTMPPEVKARIDKAKSHLSDAKVKLEDASKQPREKAGNIADEAQSKARDVSDAVQQNVGDIATRAKDQLKKDLESLRHHAKGAKEKGENKAEDIKQEANDKAPEAKQKAQDLGDKAKETAGQAEDKAAETKDQAKDKANEAKDTADKKKEDTKAHAKRPASKDSSKSRIPKRDQSPVKRETSPHKKDPKSASTNGDGTRDKPVGEENEKDEDKEEATNGLDESAYEVNPDELKSEEEEKAEKEMQPGES